jgi:hypothetical protein
MNLAQDCVIQFSPEVEFCYFATCSLVVKYQHFGNTIVVPIFRTDFILKCL